MPTLFKRFKICNFSGKWHRVSLRILHVQGHGHIFDIALHRNANNTLGHKERAPEIIDRVGFSEILRWFASETLVKQFIEPTDLLCERITQEIIHIHNHKKVAGGMIKHRRLILATHETGATGGLGSCPPVSQRLRPPSWSRAFPIKRPQLSPVFNRAINRIDDFEIAPIRFWKRVRLKKRCRYIPGTDLAHTRPARPRHTPTGT